MKVRYFLCVIDPTIKVAVYKHFGFNYKCVYESANAARALKDLPEWVLSSDLNVITPKGDSFYLAIY